MELQRALVDVAHGINIASLRLARVVATLAVLIPSSIVLIGAGAGLISAANRLRNERRRQVFFSAMPYFAPEGGGLAVAGRF